MNQVVFSSVRHDWETPQRFFDVLDAEFGFHLDACAVPENAKCDQFLTPGDDALTKDWRGVVYCNPPYGYGIHRWVKKAYDEAQKGAVVVALIPAKPDTSWWHSYVMKAEQIRFIKGRLRFSGHTVNAPFPSAVVVFRRGIWTPTFSTMDRYLEAA